MMNKKSQAGIIAILLIAGALLISGGTRLFAPINVPCSANADCIADCPDDVDHCYCYNDWCYTCKGTGDYCDQNYQCCSSSCLSNECVGGDTTTTTIGTTTTTVGGGFDCTAIDYGQTRCVGNLQERCEYGSWVYLRTCNPCVQESTTYARCDNPVTTTTTTTVPGQTTTTTTIIPSMDCLPSQMDKIQCKGGQDLWICAHKGSQVYNWDLVYNCKEEMENRCINEKTLRYKHWDDVVCSQIKDEYICRVFTETEGGCCIPSGTEIPYSLFGDGGSQCCSRTGIEFAYKPENTGIGIQMVDFKLPIIGYVLKFFSGGAYPSGKPVAWNRDYELLPGIPLIKNIGGWQTNYYCGDRDTLPTEKKQLLQGATELDPDTGKPITGPYAEDGDPCEGLPLGMEKLCRMLSENYCLTKDFCFTLFVWVVIAFVALFFISFLRR